MRPHDLLRLNHPAVLSGEDAPAWVAESLRRAPFVVVRRVLSSSDHVPVGVRGATRDRRFACAIHPSDVAAVITPEALAQKFTWRTTARRELAPFASMDRVARVAAQCGLTWGPAGSAGFELASGVATLSESSDLDIVVRPTRHHSRDDLARFRDDIETPTCHIDVVIECDAGAVALDEWLESPQRVLIKTPHGPQLGAFAW